MDTAAYRARSSMTVLQDKLRGFLCRAEIDRAVFFGVLAKVWSAISGPLTALLIIIRFTPVYQGYYYTFGSLLALQVFVELGLGTVIIQFASHEWAKLKMDDHGGISGDKDALSRLISLAGITFKWFSAGGVIAALCLGSGGRIFFLHYHDTHINWVLPWFSVCLLTGINICFIPVWSLLEGCNQVSAVYMYRFFQGIIASVAVWIAIFSGAKLWSVAIFLIATLSCAVVFLALRYREFIKVLLFTKPSGSYIDWRGEILPMQWRIAISTISSYFVFSFFTPIIFRYHGPVIAGQFGMTWSLILMVSAVSASWISPKVPRFGMLIAQKNYAELDRLFWRVTKIFMIITAASSMIVWSGVYLLNRLNHPFAHRLLPVLPATFFLIAQMIMVLSVPFSAYMRAHKKEPILFVAISYTILSILATFILGKYCSVTTVGLGYMVINIAVVPIIILIWHRCRIEWRKGILI